MEDTFKHYLEIKEELIFRINYYNNLLDKLDVSILDIKRLECIIDFNYDGVSLTNCKKLLLDTYLSYNREIEKYYSIKKMLFSLEKNLDKVNGYLNGKKKIIKFRTRN